MADYSISLGIELDTSNLQKQIDAAGSNKTIPLKIEIENLSEIKKQIDSLGGTKSKDLLTFDTTKLENSLKDVKSVITDIRNSLGTLDNGGSMKSLVASINQIGTALDKASIKFDSFAADLKTLSSKDFSIKFNLKLGGGNFPSNSAAYGDYVRQELYPELKRQEQAITKYLAKHYNTNEISAIQKLYKASGRNGGFQSVWAMLDQLESPIKKGDILSDRVSQFKNFFREINSMAKSQNIDLSPIMSQFDKLPDELIENANDIKNGTKEIEESVNRLNSVFGGNNNINIEGLSTQLDSIVSDLKEIKTILQGLSSGISLEGLTASFDKLSSSIEKLVNNITLAKSSLGDGFDAVSGVDASSISKIEQASDSSTAAVVSNEKKKQEAYKATADAVMYHAGIISKLNKAETNGRFYGSNRGTGYFGTGHYFVDSATKHELDNNGSYNKLPYTSIDISQYDNLFKATNDEVASKLHDFLRNLTRFTQGSDSFDLSELFSQFKDVFGDTIMDVKEFGSRLDQLKTFMAGSYFDDRTDSVSTQFMKSLGYGGVDTRGTKYADTRYGTVIYDLKEESILQANITDEIQKRGQMLEKINYEQGQVFDKNTDAKIQSQLDAQIKRKEIAAEFEKSFNSINLDKAEAELDVVQKRIEEIDSAIGQFQYSLDNLDQEYEKSMRELSKLGFDDDDWLLFDDEEEWKKDHAEIYKDGIDQLSQEKAELQSKIPILEEVYNKEQQLANEAYEQAKQTVEQRRLEAQQAQESANDIVQSEKRKQQAYRETANEAKKSADASLSKEAEKINKKLSDSDLGFSKYDNEIDSVTTKFNKLENQSEQLQSDMKLLNSTFADIKAASAANDVEALVSANREYEQVLTRVKNQLDINSRAEKEATAIAKKEAAETAKAQKEAAAIADKMQKEADAAALKETNAELKKLKDLAHQMGQLDFKIVKSDYNDEIEKVREFERQLELVKKQYNETVKSLSAQDIDVGDITTPEFVKARNDIAEFEAQVEVTKRKLADGIKLRINTDIAKNISAVHSDFNKLSIKSTELQQKLDLLDNIKIDLDTAKAKNDIEGLIAANEKYEQVLKDIKAQLDINKRAQGDSNDSVALRQNADNLSLKMDNWLKDNSAAAKQFGSRIRELQAELKSCDGVRFDGIKREFEAVKQEAKAAGKTTQTLGDKLKTQFSKYSAYFGVAELFMWVEQGLRDMFEQVKAIDSAMTELKKVTDETDATYNEFLSNAAARSKEIGTTIDGLVASTADFARLGYEFKDAQGLAEVANIYAVVGDEINGVEGATESLISTMAAFKDAMNGMSNTDFAMSIIDKFNEIGNNFAISSGGIGEALERSASSLMAANNTIDESIALITAANTVVQDPAAVGTAFKTKNLNCLYVQKCA